MEGGEDLQSYIRSIWDLIQPSARLSQNTASEEFLVKVADARKKIIEIIKKMETPESEEVRIVGICAPDGTPLPIQSTSKSVNIRPQDSTEKQKTPEKNPAKSVEFYEDDAEEDYGDYDLDEIKFDLLPPPPGVRIVGICAPDGTPLPLPSTSKSSDIPKDATEKKKPDKKKPVKFYWDDDNAADFYDDYAEFLKEKKSKESLRHLYRILFWLDFLSTGFSCDKQHLRHF